MEYLIGFVINFLDFFACDNLMSSFFDTNANNKTKFKLYLFKFFFLHILCENIMVGINDVKTLLVFSTHFALFYIIYKTYNIIVIILIWYVLSSAIEFLAISCFVVLFNISVQEIVSSAIYFTIVTLSYCLFLYAFCYMMRKWLRKNLNSQFMSKKEWLVLSVYPSINFLIIYIILFDNLQNGNVELSSLLISIMLIISSLILFYLISEICKSNIIKQSAIAREREEIAKKDYLVAVQSAYNTQRQLTHDYNRELATLKSILQLKDYDKLESYLNKLVGNSQKNKLVVLTHNSIIDAILNQKYTEANMYNVAMEFVLDDLSGLPIRDEDIVIILANAIDNAIVAAKNSEAKLIQVFMSYNNDEFLCAIKNSISERVIIENNEVIRDNLDIYHGFGLKNIRAAISKYDSHLTLESTIDRFIITISINF